MLIGLFFSAIKLSNIIVSGNPTDDLPNKEDVFEAIIGVVSSVVIFISTSLVPEEVIFVVVLFRMIVAF